LVVKTFCKKSWIWIKEHWQIPFLFLWTVGVWIVARRNTDAMLEVINAKKDSYKKQLEVLKDSHSREILERDRLMQHYEDALKKVEADFVKNKEELTNAHKNSIKEVVIKSKGNPDEIRKRIEEEFGIRYVE